MIIQSGRSCGGDVTAVTVVVLICQLIPDLETMVTMEKDPTFISFIRENPPPSRVLPIFSYKYLHTL